MTADAGLVLAWLILAHLIADFVLQPGRMARAKAAPGSGATPALLGHALVVGICVLPSGSRSGRRAGGSWRLSRSVTRQSIGSRRS